MLIQQSEFPEDFVREELDFHDLWKRHVAGVDGRVYSLQVFTKLSNAALLF